MPSFEIRPAAELVAQEKTKNVGVRSQIAEAFRNAMQEAILDRHDVLYVTLEEGDLPLTTKNRLHAAAKALGVETEVHIRKVRNQNQMMAYRESDLEAIRASLNGSAAALPASDEVVEEDEESGFLPEEPVVPAAPVAEAPQKSKKGGKRAAA